MPLFKLSAQFKPAGDQPGAIVNLVTGLEKNLHCQTLLGVTGSGKTFTMANVIEKLQRPTLVIAHNKTLAAQLCAEFREFFPENSVEYFVSYYDYYQPEAYIPQTDTYIAKDASINDEIDRLRHSATQALFERRDVIVVASVSCIYGLGLPEDYLKATIPIKKGDRIERDELLAGLVAIKYERNDLATQRSNFRVRGDAVEIWPAYSEKLLRIQFDGDRIEKIFEVDEVSFKILSEPTEVRIYPGTHYVTFKERIDDAAISIKAELKERLKEFKSKNKLLEAQRLETRTKYDLEMIQEIGYCAGIENYSRHLSGRLPGEPPGVLIDYFPEDFLIFIDESHATVPQIGGMYHGDRVRKETLIEHGFRLPSALDNRPLKFEEFEEKINQVIFVSATPGPYEQEKSFDEYQKNKKQLPATYPKNCLVEQIIRPTGLVDPEIIILPISQQVDDLVEKIKGRVNQKERTLVITLTKKMAEDLAGYLANLGLKVRYLHSDIDTLERVEVIKGLRLGEFDVLVGINLLREGLDLPEVSLVAILDADKEGFLRAERSLIQIIGRASRNVNGQVILYADKITASIQKAVAETNRRRKLQQEFNQKHGITPKSIVKEVKVLKIERQPDRIKKEIEALKKRVSKIWHPGDLPGLINELRREMERAAGELDFERAAVIRDQIVELEKSPLE